MTKSNIFKKAFSLFELLISILLIGLIFGLYLSNSKKIPDKNEKNIKLETLKSDLLKNFTFEKNLRLICIENNLSCFVLIDDEITKEHLVENVFTEVPDVYKYNINLEIQDYNYIEFNNSNVEKIIFEFTINSDFKIKELVLYYQNKYFIYNAINLNATIVKNKYEILTIFQNNLLEVQNAFSL